MASFVALFLLCSLFVARLCYATTDTITRNNFLRDGETLVSSGGNYALGFFSPGNSQKRYIGIWYNKIEEQTVVWVANRDSPIQNNSSGILKIVERGNLAIYNANSSNPVWSTNVSLQSSKNIKPSLFYKLLDTGNLVLCDEENMAGFLWQSFDYPTDTHLPGMKLGMNLKLGTSSSLRSWKSPDDPSTWDFSFEMSKVGSIELVIKNGSQKIWRTGEWNGQWWNGVTELKASGIMNFSVVSTPDEIYYIYNFRNTSVFTKAVLDNLGFVRRTTWAENTKRWNTLRSYPDDACDNYGKCGSFGRCNPNYYPSCSCLPGFNFKSTNEGDAFEGSQICVRSRELLCGKGDGFLKLETMKLPDSSNARVDMSLGIKECEIQCRNNCSCTGYSSAYVDGSGCIAWFGDLNDVRDFPPWGQDLFVRVDAIELENSVGHSKGSFTKKKLVLLCVLLAGGSLILIYALCYFFKKAKGRGLMHRERSQKQLRNLLSWETNEETSANGYMSPEYAMNGLFSMKSDIFSFGVLLLEIISGQKNTGFYNKDRPMNLIQHAWEHWKDGRPLELVDPTMGTSFPEQEVMKFIQVGILSVQEDANDRPTMSSIIYMSIVEAEMIRILFSDLWRQEESKLGLRRYAIHKSKRDCVSHIAAGLFFFVDGMCSTTDSITHNKFLRDGETIVSEDSNTKYSLGSQLKQPSLRDEHGGNFLWQSFDFLTDAHLPGVKLGFSLKPRVSWSLTSWKYPDDPSTGDFTISMTRKGPPEFVIKNGSQKIWRTGPWDGRTWNGLPTLRANPIFNYSLVTLPYETYHTYIILNTLVSKVVLEVVAGLFYFPMWDYYFDPHISTFSVRGQDLFVRVDAIELESKRKWFAPQRKIQKQPYKLPTSETTEETNAHWQEIINSSRFLWSISLTVVFPVLRVGHFLLRKKTKCGKGLELLSVDLPKVGFVFPNRKGRSHRVVPCYAFTILPCRDHLKGVDHIPSTLNIRDHPKACGHRAPSQGIRSRCYETEMKAQYVGGTQPSYVLRSVLYNSQSFFVDGMCSTTDSITHNKFLRDGETIVSEGGVYTLGFFSPGNSKQRYIGIWYTKIPIENIVWVANRNNPVNASSSGIVKMDERGNLVILNGNVSKPVWSTNVSIPINDNINSSSLVYKLLDSGNLVLCDKNGGDFLWQSSDFLTDTHLPGVKLGFSLKPRVSWSLTSWKSPDDPSTGDFTISMTQKAPPEFVIKNGSQKIWRTGPWDGRTWNGLPTLRANPIFNYSLVTLQDETYYTYIILNTSLVSKVVLDYLGILRRKTWSESIGRWNTIRSFPEDTCDNYAKCGVFGICSPNDSPICSCLPGFQFNSSIEGYLLEGTQRCVRKRELLCGKGDGFLKLANIKLPDTSNARVDMSLGIKECEIECRNNCSCNGYSSAYFDGSGCLVWFGDLVDIKSFPTGGQDLFVRVDAIELDRTRSKSLDWRMRRDIILGVARGVLYLHQDSRLRIVHRDLKASNVLLDAQMNPKISDFGMARICGGDQTEGSTNRVVGTFGYMSPEYAMDGLFSTKSDVFSFGVLLLEVISGQKNTGFYYQDRSMNLIKHAWDLWKDGRSFELVDPSMGTSFPELEVAKFIQVGILSIQENANDRPTMSSIILMLGNEITIPTPKQPGFVLTSNIDHQSSPATETGFSSVNEMSTTTVDGR
ncbi:hypothetical protein Sjap_025409 [Stephania japonica]|uniref:Uncharacterized protein n=1 Tax=Stephania japonica TaxID=461633 RepID=A0AAP0E9E9_9MAGN